jgi:riboflavin synthase
LQIGKRIDKMAQNPFPAGNFRTGQRRFGQPRQIGYLDTWNSQTMFTGIIEHLGTISRLEFSSGGGKLTIHAPSLAPKLIISSSVAANGCCLTVVRRDKENFSADLSAETLEKTSFSSLKTGAAVNLEQPLTAGKEFGGHFVQGHIDGTGRVARLESEGDSWLYGVAIPSDLARYIVPKGSITIDGISLTVAHWRDHVAEIAVIPYTYEHTNIRDRVPGDLVNLEADILGKYIERYLAQRESQSPTASLRVQDLINQGF